MFISTLLERHLVHTEEANMRALIKMIGILLLMSVFGCNNAEAIKQARLDQAHIDLLQQTNEKLVEDLKFEKARADNAETKLALCNKPAVDPSDAITQTARASVKRLTPGADATLCVSTWSNATTHIELFVCKTPTENEPQCSARVVRTMDGHGDRLISQTNIDCERYAEMVAVIAKK